MQLFFPEYLAYLQRLCDEHVKVKTFVFGSSERLLRRQAEHLEYPVVWCALPTIISEEDGNYRFDTMLSFLDYCENEEGDEDQGILEMSCVAMDFHLRMQKDHNEGLLGYKQAGTVLQPKARWSGDNDHGYVMECDLVFGSAHCYNPANFSAL